MNGLCYLCLPQSHYWLHISASRFIGLTLPPSLLFAFLTVLLFPSSCQTLPHSLLSSSLPPSFLTIPFAFLSFLPFLSISLPTHPHNPLPALCLCPHLTLLGLSRCRCPFGSGTAGAGAESRVPLPTLSVLSASLSA